MCYLPPAHMISTVIFVSYDPSGYFNVIRIAGGGRRGRVEIFHQGSWGTICDDDWDNLDASVVCRMMGYNRAISAYTASGGESSAAPQAGLQGYLPGWGIMHALQEPQRGALHKQ